MRTATRSFIPHLRTSSVPAVAFVLLRSAIGLLGVATPLVAQDGRASDPPPHLAYVDGQVSIAREDDLLDAAAGQPLVPGDRLRTASGRAEIWLTDGSTLALDNHTTVEVREDQVWHLSTGQVALIVSNRLATDDVASNRDSGADRGAEYQIDTPAGSVVTRDPGEYRVSLRSAHAEEFVELTVIRGTASLLGDSGSMTARTGERTISRLGTAPSYPEVVRASSMGAFSRWVTARRDARLRRPQAARYLPPTLQMYGNTFDRYGTWEHDAAYGHVWYPTVVAGWQPYYNGYWTALRPYGWTWIGFDVWGWPTHHYGRWGYGRSRWFWIPGRHWGPAWVSWAGAPGYVGWCPLGFNDRPVFSFAYSTGRHWDGWVVLPRTSFGYRGHHVTRYAVDHRRIAAPFTVGTSPELPRFAVRTGVRADGRTGIARPRVGGPSSPAAAPTWPSTPPRRWPGDSSRDTARPSRIPDGGDRARVIRRAPDAGASASSDSRASPGGRPHEPGWRTPGRAPSEWQVTRGDSVPDWGRRSSARRWSSGDVDRRSSRDPAASAESSAVPAPRPGPLLPHQYQNRGSDHPIYAPGERSAPRAVPRSPFWGQSAGGSRDWSVSPRSFRGDGDAPRSGFGSRGGAPDVGRPAPGPANAGTAPMAVPRQGGSADGGGARSGHRPSR